MSDDDQLEVQGETVQKVRATLTVTVQGASGRERTYEASSIYTKPAATQPASRVVDVVVQQVAAMVTSRNSEES